MSATANPDVEHKIIRQVEYYFGDFNLPKDKFLLEEIKKDDGWVPLETMIKFKRLAALSSDCAVIAEALKKSRTSLMQVSEDNTKIRRNPEEAVPATMKDVYDKYEDRTLFVKGFKTTASLDEVQNFFDKAGIILNIVMRRCPNRKGFKGSVFVTFQNKEESEKFVSSPEFESFDGVPLIRMLRTAYVEKKAEEKQQQKATRAEAQLDAEKKRLQMRKSRLLSRMTLGALLELTGLPQDIKESEAVTSIKGMMRTCGTPDVAFVETDDLAEGRVVVRFKDENSAAQAMSKLQSTENALNYPRQTKEEKAAEEVSESGDPEDSKDQVKSEADAEMAANDNSEEQNGNAEKKVEPKQEIKEEDIKEEEGASKPLVCRVLSGEEEQKLWERILEQRDKRQMNRKGRHGYGGHRDEPQRKRQRVSNK